MDRMSSFTEVDAYMKCSSVLAQHKKIYLSYSGGSDSDTLLDLVQRVIKDTNWQGEIDYVFFDTGIEYQATKDHIPYIEKKYGITIQRVRANIPVPLGCKKYGQPFLSKDVSQKISALQSANFDFVNDGNKSYEELMKKYPKRKDGIGWWCNQWGKGDKLTCQFNINQKPYLKEFMMLHPPTFKISDKCCWGAKKSTAHKFYKDKKADLTIRGLRKAEGGIRTFSVKSCYNEKTHTYDPLFWFSDKDKQKYKDYYHLTYSDCYEKYGMKRTGCAGCPFNSKFEDVLTTLKEHEPKLYLAVNNIFGDSYAYTRAYREFKKKKQQEAKQIKGQISLFD